MFAAVFHDPARPLVKVYWLTINHHRAPPEALPFLKEENLKALFPDAVWWGQAKPGAKETILANWHTPEEVAALGARVYEHVYPDDDANEFPAGEFPPQANVGPLH